MVANQGGGGDSAGTLYVDVDARLDAFDEKMRRLEQNGPQSAKAVERAMADTTAATRETEGAIEGVGSSLFSIGAGVAARKFGLRRIIGFLSRITGVAGAASAALAALAPALVASGVLITLGAVSKAVDLTRRTMERDQSRSPCAVVGPSAPQ